MSVKRAEKRREEQEAKKAELRERGVKHYKRHLGEHPPRLPIVPTTQRQMQEHLSGKHKDTYRDPITRAEKRSWDKFWKMKGQGFTKSVSTGDRF